MGASVPSRQSESSEAVMPSPVRALSLKANFSWTLVGNAVYSGCQWGMLVALAKMGTPEMVGQYALGLAVCAPLMMFSNLQLRVIQATDVKDDYRFGDYFGLRVFTTGLAFLVIAALTALSKYRWETALVVLLVGVAKCFESFSDVLYGFSQKHERLDLIAISMMIKGPLALGAMVVAIALTGKVFWGALALSAAWAVPFVMVDVPNALRFLKPLPGYSPRSWLPVSLKQVLRLAWVAAPMGWVVFMLSLCSNMPRYFLQSALGEKGVGLFSAVAALPGVMVLIINPLTHSVLPRLAHLNVQGDRSFWSLLMKTSLIVVGGGVVFIAVSLLLGGPLLKILYGGAYANLGWLLVLLGVAATAQNLSTVLGVGLTSSRKFGIQGVMSTALCLFTLLACAMLIGKFGLYGSGLSLIAFGLLQVVLYGAALSFEFRK